MGLEKARVWGVREGRRSKEAAAEDMAVPVSCLWFEREERRGEERIGFQDKTIRVCDRQN